MNSEKLPFEAALDKVGFGLYSYLLTALAGFITVAASCITFSSMFIVPTSACELGTTPGQQGMLAAGPVVGLLTGSMWGYLSDTRGRRAMLLVALTCSSVINLIATISVNWIMLLILQFLAAVFLSGAYSMTMTLISESFPIAKRNIVMLIVSSIFLFAQGVMALLAIPIIRLTFSFYIPALDIYWNSWRTLMAVFSIPCMISAVCLYFMQESPKYVFVKGDEDRALEILKTLHKLNNRGTKEEFLLVNTVGRRNMALIILTVCGISGILVNLVPNVIASGVFFTIMLLGFLLFGLYTAIAVALFPTNLRTMALALSITVGHDLGTIASIQILNLLLVNNCDAGFYLFASILLVLAIPIIRLTFSFYIPALDIYWNSWRTLMAVFSIPCMISAVCLYFMQESPKYVFVKGDEDRALEILKTLHKLNNRGTKEEFLVKGLLKDEMTVTSGPASAKDQIVPLFKAPLLKSTIIMIILFLTQQIGAFLVWLPTIADRFMRALQAGGSNDLTICGVLDLEAPPLDPDAMPCALDETSLYFVVGIAALQSIFNLIISFLVNTVGRRNMALIILTVCGISGILVNLVPNVIASGVFFTIMLLGFLLFGLYTAIAVALFPTNLRTMALALSITVGHDLGTIASIQILNLLLVNNCDAGFYLFASILLASVAAAALLPDDRRIQNPCQCLFK